MELLKGSEVAPLLFCPLVLTAGPRLGVGGCLLPFPTTWRLKEEPGPRTLDTPQSQAATGPLPQGVGVGVAIYLPA